jgi:polar amino acid transport system substrate-binding protein
MQTLINTIQNYTVYGILGVVLLLVILVLLILSILLFVLFRKKSNREKEAAIARKKLSDDYNELEQTYIEATTTKEQLITKNEELKQNNEKLKKLAYTDYLTEMPNHLAFTEMLDSVMLTLRNEEVIALMHVDIDNFKNINDTFGHLFGDSFLRNVGQCLKVIITDGMVVRFGGDEFAVLISHIADRSQAIELAAKIIKAFQKPWVLEKKEFYTTTSIGITYFPDDGTDAATLLKNADAAMYNAKENGKDGFDTYTRGMNSGILERLDMESSMRRALEKGEFQIYYQPQIDLSTGKLHGVEALIRWNHPVKGLLFPNSFIPIAEQSGLIIPIGDWVLRTACQRNKLWQEKGFEPFPISVNLSARQFQQPNLCEKIGDILSDTDLDPKWLHLEITESIAIKDINSTVRTLNQLIRMGVGIELDDFGTGYSSMIYLKQLPIRGVKMDKSFVAGITENSKEEAIARAIITLAHNMNLVVVAEGVETKEQANYLYKQKCDIGQGFYFSKPLEADKLQGILTKYV